MNIERSFELYPPEAIPIRVAEPIRTASELEQLVMPEVVLFTKIGEKKDPKTPDQVPKTNQTDELIKTKPSDDWEPFSQEPTGNNRFLNFYNGSYSQEMEINRKRVEQAIKVESGTKLVVD